MNLVFPYANVLSLCFLSAARASSLNERVYVEMARAEGMQGGLQRIGHFECRDLYKP